MPPARSRWIAGVLVRARFDRLRAEVEAEFGVSLVPGDASNMSAAELVNLIEALARDPPGEST